MLNSDQMSSVPPRFLVKVFVPNNAVFPAIFEFNDLDMAILEAWKQARAIGIWYTAVVDQNAVTIANFNLKEYEDKGGIVNLWNRAITPEEGIKANG